MVLQKKKKKRYAKNILKDISVLLVPKKFGIIKIVKWTFPKIRNNNIIQYSPNICQNKYSNPNSRGNTHIRHYLSQNKFQDIKDINS
jgi:hypothetical protein